MCWLFVGGKKFENCHVEKVLTLVNVAVVSHCDQNQKSSLACCVFMECAL